MLVNINKRPYHIFEDEFNKISHNVYTNLSIRTNVGFFERICSLIVELSESLNIQNRMFFEQTHGGFIPINCLTKGHYVYVVNKTDSKHNENIIKNINLHHLHNLTNINLTNIKYLFQLNFKQYFANNLIIYAENSQTIEWELIDRCNPIILTNINQNHGCFQSR